MEKSRVCVLVQHHSILSAGLFDVEAEWPLDTEDPFQVGARLFWHNFRFWQLSMANCVSLTDTALKMALSSRILKSSNWNKTQQVKGVEKRNKTSKTLSYYNRFSALSLFFLHPRVKTPFSPLTTYSLFISAPRGLCTVRMMSQITQANVSPPWAWIENQWGGGNVSMVGSPCETVAVSLR